MFPTKTRRASLAALSAVAAAGLACGPCSGEELQGAQIRTLLADGGAWSARMGGMAAKVVLRPDGSGQIDGPVRMSGSWYISQDRLCIEAGMFAGTRCLNLKRVGTNVEGYEGGKLAVRLSR